MPTAPQKTKSHAQFHADPNRQARTSWAAPPSAAKVNWANIGTVAGSTLSGVGVGLSSIAPGVSSSATAPVMPDSTPILVLGGVLLVGVILFAMTK